MSFIGVFTTSKNEIKLKHLLKETSKCHHIFYLHDDNIRNMKNITFETILIGKNIDSSKEKIRNLVQKADYLILNNDEKDNVEILKDLNLNLITYGLGSKCTITVSSIEEEQIMLCLQRSIKTPQRIKIEPQEMPLPLKQKEDIYALLEAETLVMLYPDLKNAKPKEEYNFGKYNQ